MDKPLMSEIGDRIDRNLANYFQSPVDMARNNAAALKLGVLNYQDISTIKRYFWQQSQVTVHGGAGKRPK